jgi:antitoxin ParD1/3/4
MEQERDFVSLDICLTRELRDFVDAQAASTGCNTTSEYVRRLIHEAQNRVEQEELERKLIEGLESGDASEIDSEYWKKKRKELLERHLKRKP